MLLIATVEGSTSQLQIKDGVLFAARFLEQAMLDTPSSIIMYTPTDQG
jgi:hypothetical protein